MGLLRRKRQEPELPTFVPINAEAAALLGDGSSWPSEGEFDLHGFFTEMWELGFMPTVNVLDALGIECDEFYEEAMLEEQYDGAAQAEREARLVQAMQWSNMLDDSEGGGAHVLGVHGTMRLKALGLAIACDANYGTEHLKRISIAPLEYGTHEPGG